MQQTDQMLTSHLQRDHHPARVEAGQPTLEQPVGEDSPHSLSRSPAPRSKSEEPHTYCLDPETGLYLFLE